ncbi:hypothetical protein [Streptomyces olivaceus]
MNAPANLFRRLAGQLDDARQAGDRATYADLRTSWADIQAYQAAQLGIPTEYLDSTSGLWTVAEDVCWGCWKPIEGPVVALGVNAECRHYHPHCQTGADFGRLWDGEHGRPACKSRLPYYNA